MTGSSFYSLEKIADGRSGGTTQAETRVYNERLIVSLVRRHGQLSKADLTRLTGLAPMTITTIVNRAADDGLLIRQEPLRGRLGQPSVPYALNAEAAYSFGLKIDHRGADLALVNFIGQVVAFERVLFDYPTPAAVMSFARAGIARMTKKHKLGGEGRIAGLGIASPFHQWRWDAESGKSAAKLEAWKKLDIRAELDLLFAWPVYLFNDTTVAAGAELMFGCGLGRADFLYAYVGHFVGGGLVLDHHLFAGRNRLAAALGTMPIPATRKQGGKPAPFSRVASVASLADRIDAATRDRIYSSPEDWGDLGAPLEEWIDEVSSGLTHATQNAVALLDVDNLVIDGACPALVRREIAKATRRKLARSVADRPEPFSVLEGTFGHLAPAVGGASIPLLVSYSNDKQLLFKE